jgi:Spy/CpxP family protein refolding chaperone
MMRNGKETRAHQVKVQISGPKPVATEQRSERTMEGKPMWHRIAVLTMTVLALTAGGTLLRAEETSPKRHGSLEALTAKLGLSDQQQEAIRKIHADWKTNTAPIKQQLRTLHQEKRQAMKQVLTAEQRAMLPEIRKAASDKKWQAVAAKLGLSDEQKERVEKTRSEYARKFQDLAAKKGETTREQFRTLRHEKIQAIRSILTPEQSAKLGAMVRAEKQERRNPEHRQAFWKGIGEKLSVTAEQKEQFQKIRADFASKMEKPAAQLKQLREEKRIAVEKVLTPEQRAKFQELRKSRGEAKSGTTEK